MDYSIFVCELFFIVFVLINKTRIVLVALIVEMYIYFLLEMSDKSV